MTRLTKKRLQAMQEALMERLAGEIETEFAIKDYQAALDWTGEQLERRQNERPSVGE